eukprot:gene882-1105_t
MRVLLDLVEVSQINFEEYNIKKRTFIEIHPNQSIWMVKTIIFSVFQIPPARQQVFLKVLDEKFPKEKSKSYSKQLHNYRIVKDYHIVEGSEIQVVALEKELPSEFLVTPKKNNTISSSDKAHHLQLLDNNQQLQQPQTQLNLSTSLPTGNNNNGSHGGKPNNNKVHVLSSKKGACPALCFAIGKGLYRGISGMKYEIKLYRVDSKGMLINTTHHNFQIDIVKQKTSSVENKKMQFTYEQRKSEYSLLTLHPSTFGHYSINIKIDDIPICGSPFQCSIIDELNPALKELAFSNEWIEEIVELITLMSKKESTIDNLFSFGIEGLINLMFYPDPTVQVHITGVFSKLLEKDKNKERVLKEGGIGLFFKLVSLDNWTSFMELRRFVSSCLCILSSNKAFVQRFFNDCDLSLLSILSNSEHIDCMRSCAIALSQISENYEYSEYLISDQVKDVLINMLSSKDPITINSSLKTIANLSSSFGQRRETLIRLLSRLLECCRTFTDVSNKVLIFKSFSNFCVNANGILELITPNTDSFNYFGIPMFYQWEFNTRQILCSENPIQYSSSLSQIFKDETDCAFFQSLTISNMLVATNSHRIHEHFSMGNGLKLLKQFILCHDCSARAEAFRSFMLMTNSPNDNCKKNLIQNGIFSFLVSSLSDSSPVETPFIINSLAYLCEFENSCVESIGIDGVEKFIQLLNQHNESTTLQVPISLILAHLCKNDKYKNKIVTGGGKLFLHHLIELVRQGRVTVMKSIGIQDVEMICEVGRGVSGVVWKSLWNGHEVAVKTFNEDNLGFNEREFLSETTIMSVLRHDNIVHCIGGSRTQGRIRMTKAVGTPCYMAVEVLQGLTEYTQQADVYSFGFVLWECISRLIPYHEMEQIDWIRSVLEHSYRPPIPDTCIIEISSLIKRCWDSDPNVRPTFAEIITYLEQVKEEMEQKGIYEEIISSKYLNREEPRGYTEINENNVALDLSLHPTEVLQNLVIDDPNDSNAVDIDMESSKSSSSTSSSANTTVSPASDITTPMNSTSPTNISPISPMLPRKWESAAPERPNNAKRLSAFRTISLKDLQRGGVGATDSSSSGPIPIPRENNNISPPLMNSEQSSIVNHGSDYSTMMLMSSTSSISGLQSDQSTMESTSYSTVNTQPPSFSDHYLMMTTSPLSLQSTPSSTPLENNHHHHNHNYHQRKTSENSYAEDSEVEYIFKHPIGLPPPHDSAYYFSIHNNNTPPTSFSPPKRQSPSPTQPPSQTTTNNDLISNTNNDLISNTTDSTSNSKNDFSQIDSKIEESINNNEEQQEKPLNINTNNDNVIPKNNNNNDNNIKPLQPPKNNMYVIEKKKQLFQSPDLKQQQPSSPTVNQPSNNTILKSNNVNSLLKKFEEGNKPPIPTTKPAPIPIKSNTIHKK